MLTPPTAFPTPHPSSPFHMESGLDEITFIAGEPTLG